MNAKKIMSVCLAMALAPCFASAQQAAFTKVKVRFNKSAKDPVLVDKDVNLIFNDSGKRLLVKGDYKPLELGYGDIQKAVFDVSAHMRGGALSQVIGGLAGAAIASAKVNDYWCYLEYKKPDGSAGAHMLEIDKEHSQEVIDKMKAIAGADKVIVAQFAEKEDKIEKNTLKDLQSKHDLKVDKTSRPNPELKPDKALVVIVCPALAARYAGKGTQYKVHANDKVIAVNKMGTYFFTYLDPGEYLLASQAENASGFKMNLEAGKDYYFLQDTFMGAWKARTALTRHTKELVMHEMSGAYWSNWTRKK
jgi:hypothetical protein